MRQTPGRKIDEPMALKVFRNRHIAKQDGHSDDSFRSRSPVSFLEKQKSQKVLQ